MGGNCRGKRNVSSSSPFGDIKVDDGENCPSSLLEDGSRYGLGEIPSDKQYEGAVWSFVLLIEKHTRAEESGEKVFRVMIHRAAKNLPGVKD